MLYPPFTDSFPRLTGNFQDLCSLRSGHFIAQTLYGTRAPNVVRGKRTPDSRDTARAAGPRAAGASGIGVAMGPSFMETPHASNSQSVLSQRYTLYRILRYDHARCVLNDGLKGEATNQQ